MNTDCLFCKFVRKEIPVKAAYEDEQTLAFHDIHPQAPLHILIIPKKHYGSVVDIAPGDPVVSILTDRAVQLARELQVEKKGYRLVLNTNQDGGQTVFHLHLHLLAGRPMTWPPG